MIICRCACVKIGKLTLAESKSRTYDGVNTASDPADVRLENVLIDRVTRDGAMIRMRWTDLSWREVRKFGEARIS
jgi:hypothetical protein